MFFFFSSRRRHTRWNCDWSSDVCSSDLGHRSEHFLLPDPAALGVEEDGRLEEEARPVETAAAAGELRALLARGAHLPFDVLEDLLGRQRTQLGGVVLRVADLQRAHPLDETLLELRGDLLVDDEPLGGDAALARVLDAGGDAHLDGLVEVGAGQHDEGIASPQLQHRLLHLRACDAAQAPARRVASRQGGGDDARVLDDLLHLVAADQQRLEGALREARVAEDLLDGERALRDVARVLEQADVPGHQRGRRESKDLPEGEVPGHDREHRAQRLEALLGAARVGLYGLRSEVTLGVLDVVAAPGGAFLDLGYSRPAQLAHLQRHQAGERILALFEEHRGAGHPLGAFRKGGAPPLLRSGCCLAELLFDDAVGVGGKGLERLSGRGIRAGDGHGDSTLTSPRAMRTTSGNECATHVGAAARSTASGSAPYVTAIDRTPALLAISRSWAE